jgi:hypothetical protein
MDVANGSHSTCGSPFLVRGIRENADLDVVAISANVRPAACP